MWEHNLLALCFKNPECKRKLVPNKRKHKEVTRKLHKVTQNTLSQRAVTQGTYAHKQAHGTYPQQAMAHQQPSIPASTQQCNQIPFGGSLLALLTFSPNWVCLVK